MQNIITPRQRALKLKCEIERQLLFEIVFKLKGSDYLSHLEKKYVRIFWIHRKILLKELELFRPKN